MAEASFAPNTTRLAPFVSFCTFQIVKCRLRRRRRDASSALPSFSPKAENKRPSACSQSVRGTFPFYSLSRHSGIRSSVRPSLAVGVKKSSRRLVSCQNNTSRHRARDRPRGRGPQSTPLFPCLSLCHSLRARCGSLHSLAGSPKHHLGRQGWKGWLLEIGTLLTNHFPSLPLHCGCLSQKLNNYPSVLLGPTFRLLQ